MSAHITERSNGPWLPGLHVNGTKTTQASAKGQQVGVPLGGGWRLKMTASAVVPRKGPATEKNPCDARCLGVQRPGLLMSASLFQREFLQNHGPHLKGLNQFSVSRAARSKNRPLVCTFFLDYWPTSYFRKFEGWERKMWPLTRRDGMNWLPVTRGGNGICQRNGQIWNFAF